MTSQLSEKAITLVRMYDIQMQEYINIINLYIISHNVEYRD